MKLVVIESPLAGDFARNIRYARLCVYDSIQYGEAPFASHLLYTQCLDDEDPEQRKRGMYAGFSWGARAALCAAYVDFGISGGMQSGIDRALGLGIPVVQRRLSHSLLLAVDGEGPFKLIATKGF